MIWDRRSRKGYGAADADFLVTDDKYFAATESHQ